MERYNELIGTLPRFHAQTDSSELYPTVWFENPDNLLDNISLI